MALIDSPKLNVVITSGLFFRSSKGVFLNLSGNSCRVN